jgi:uncharacterized oligopeptide transporter (OPT) family protein
MSGQLAASRMSAMVCSSSSYSVGSAILEVTNVGDVINDQKRSFLSERSQTDRLGVRALILKAGVRADVAAREDVPKRAKH